MVSRHEIWQHPLVSRYTDVQMQKLFGNRKKFTTWRELWLQMAVCQNRLGAPVTAEQVSDLAGHTQITDEEIEAAFALERNTRHDVVAHSQVYGQTCPLAAPIIHLACTSMFVGDNTDLIVMREALGLLVIKIVRCLDRMAVQARKWASQPTLAFTHIQAAQPTTVGKRIAMWMQDLLMDYEELQAARDGMKFLGAKGATGTQDSYLKFFNGDANKVRELDQMLAKAFGFADQIHTVCGQTYTRKVDVKIISVLGCMAASVHKMMLDIRLLQHLKEIEEPFETSQVASSAMPYKRNPMRSERADGLARHGLVLPIEALMTHAFQFLERTLDDSAPRRIYIPEAFLTADALLALVQNVFEGLVVYPRMIERHLREELPFMVTEHIIDAMVKAGKDRGECHEKLRVISQEAGRRVKVEGQKNPFLELVLADPYFAGLEKVLESALEPASYIGLAESQTLDFLDHEVEPVLGRHKKDLVGKSELKV